MYRTNNKLLDEIKVKREMMIDSALKTGYTSEKTIRCSQELDKLIYEYQMMIKEAELPQEKRQPFFQIKIRARHWFKYSFISRSWKSV